MKVQAVVQDSKSNEKEADQLLTQIAEREINYRAAREHA